VLIGCAAYKKNHPEKCYQPVRNQPTRGTINGEQSSQSIMSRAMSGYRPHCNSQHFTCPIDQDGWNGWPWGWRAHTTSIRRRYRNARFYYRRASDIDPTLHRPIDLQNRRSIRLANGRPGWEGRTRWWSAEEHRSNPIRTICSPSV